jgi:hypothetical protein
MAVRIQLRRDTAANWVSANPVLRAGEIGIETDTLKFKIGTGATWTATTNYANVTPTGLQNSLGDYILLANQGKAGGPSELNLDGDLIIPENSIVLWNDDNYTYNTTVTATQPTANRTITLPNNTGTVALTSDIITSTTGISEGTNLYYTDERAQDAAAAALAAGTHTNITVTYNDAGNSISLAAAPGYTDEEARDAVAGLITGATHDGVSVAYTDSGASVGTLAFTNTDKGSSQNIFKNIVVGATTVVADGNNDTLTFVGSNGVGAIANATNDVIEFYNTGVTSLTGTANEVEVDTTTGAVIVGLPNDVTISNNLTVTGDIAAADSLQLTTNAAEGSAVGKLIWDDGEGVPAIGLKGGNVDLKVGTQEVALCYNGTGSTIAKGSVVYISGAQGQRPSITLSDADTEIASSKTFGVVAEAISNGTEGFVTTFGIVSGINTSAFTPGDALWLSGTAGALTATKPSAPTHTVFVGYCLSSHASSGRIFVNPQNGYELQELHNVAITSVANDDVLKYDSATATWKNTKTLSIQDLTLSGNLTVNGTTTTVNTANLVVSDPLIYIGEGNTGNSVDLGFVSSFNNGTYQHSGLVRDASDNKWKLFKGVTDEPTSTINFTQGTLDTLAVLTLEGNVSGNLTGNVTGNVTGNLTGNADTVTNGVYTTGTYSNPSWITGLAWSKISSTPTTISGYGITDPIVLTSGTYSNPSWITALAWSKISSTPTTISGYGITNAVVTDGANTITAASASTKPLIIKAAASQSANLQEWQYSDGSTAALVSNTGVFWISTANLTNYGHSVFAGNIAGNVPIKIIAATSQSANLQEWQNSSNTVLAKVDASGNITAASIIKSGGTSSQFLKADGSTDSTTYLSGTVATTSGGTGLTSYATGDILYASATNTLSKLTAGTDGYLLTLASGVPTWAAAPISLPSQTGNSGKYLTTDGSTASWGTLVVPITTGTATITANTATTIDTNALSGFTSVEYMVSLKQGSKIRTSKVVLQTDGTSVDMTEFAITETGGTMSGVVVSATTSAGNALLQVTVTDASTTNVTVKFSEVKL